MQPSAPEGPGNVATGGALGTRAAIAEVVDPPVPSSTYSGMTVHPNIFMSFNAKDRPWIDQIAAALLMRGLNPWVYDWSNTNVETWRRQLDDEVGARSDACAVFVGPNGLGPVQGQELFDVLRRRCGETKPYAVVPVRLPGGPLRGATTVPSFLSELHWLQFPESFDSQSRLDELAARLRGGTEAARWIPRPEFVQTWRLRPARIADCSSSTWSTPTCS